MRKTPVKILFMSFFIYFFTILGCSNDNKSDDSKRSQPDEETKVTLENADISTDTDGVSTATGASTTCSKSVSISTEGDYYIGILVDDQNSITESNDDNNTDYRLVHIIEPPDVPSEKPDLIIESFSSPSEGAEFEENENFTVTVTIKNNGNTDASSFRIGIYRSSDSTINTSDAILTYCSVSSLAAGTSIPCSKSVSISTIGSQYIGVLADFQNSVSESNENNNTSSKLIEIEPETHTLSVSISGSGTVTSSPSGISCGSDCSQEYDSGTSVTLTASPSSEYTFSGWGGACSGIGSCSLVMDSDKTVTASFAVQVCTPGISKWRTCDSDKYGSDAGVQESICNNDGTAWGDWGNCELNISTISAATAYSGRVCYGTVADLYEISYFDLNGDAHVNVYNINEGDVDLYVYYFEGGLTPDSSRVDSNGYYHNNPGINSGTNEELVYVDLGFGSHTIVAKVIKYGSGCGSYTIWVED